MGFLIDVSGLQRAVGGDMRFRLKGAMSGRLPFDGDQVRFGPAEVDGRVTWTGDTVLVQAHASSRATLACSRCLAEFTLPVSTDFAQEYVPVDAGRGGGAQALGRRGAESAKSESGEGGTSSDEEPIAFSGPDIDLSSLVAESLALELPMKPVCRESCAGLCSICGSDLNLGRCGCRAETADPRLVSLKRLLEAKERGE